MLEYEGHISLANLVFRSMMKKRLVFHLPLNLNYNTSLATYTVRDDYRLLAVSLQ